VQHFATKEQEGREETPRRRRGQAACQPEGARWDAVGFDFGSGVCTTRRDAISPRLFGRVEGRNIMWSTSLPYPRSSGPERDVTRLTWERTFLSLEHRFLFGQRVIKRFKHEKLE
jgi:hypothetical protein